jgi:hypothetical protein
MDFLSGLINFVKHIYITLIQTCYEKDVQTVMVNNSTNINKTYNHLWPQTIQRRKKEHSIWPWKFRSWLGRWKKCGSVKPVKGVPLNIIQCSTNNVCVLMHSWILDDVCLLLKNCCRSFFVKLGNTMYYIFFVTI